MNQRRLPSLLLGFGALTKAILIGLSRLGDFPTVVRLATVNDPAALMFANRGASLFFSPKRIAPGNGEVQIFEVLLVLGFALECFAVGYLIRGLLKIRRAFRRG